MGCDNSRKVYCDKIKKQSNGYIRQEQIERINIESGCKSI